MGFMGNKENPYEPISLGLSKEEEVQQHAEVGEKFRDWGTVSRERPIIQFQIY